MKLSDYEQRLFILQQEEEEKQKILEQEKIELQNYEEKENMIVNPTYWLFNRLKKKKFRKAFEDRQKETFIYFINKYYKKQFKDKEDVDVTFSDYMRKFYAHEVKSIYDYLNKEGYIKEEMEVET